MKVEAGGPDSLIVIRRWSTTGWKIRPPSIISGLETVEYVPQAYRQFQYALGLAVFAL